MVTYTEAMATFIFGLFVTFAITYSMLGAAVTTIMVPIWTLSFLYPFAKRAVWFPQVILGFTMAACVLPPWMTVDKDYRNVRLPGYLFGAIFCWMIYLDLIYASQVSGWLLIDHTRERISI